MSKKSQVIKAIFKHYQKASNFEFNNSLVKNTLRFKKLNKVGINVSRKKLMDNGLIYLYTVDEDNRIVFLKVKGIRETFEKRIEIPMDIPVEKIAEIIKREL